MVSLRTFLLALAVTAVLLGAVDAKVTGAAGKLFKDRIKRIVVLMEENRSYDHLMGWYNRSKNGLSTKDFNPVNVSDPTSKKIYSSTGAPYVNFCDPDHSFPATTYKIFGPSKNTSLPPRMDGFVEFERDVVHHKSPYLHYCGVMDAFTPDRLPVMTALSDEFVMFDKLYASLPGPTWPNRLFFHSGTSAGLTETIPWYHLQQGSLFPQKTIFDQVEEAGGTWRYYYDDTPWELFLQSLAHAPEKTFDMDRFYKDCEQGTLPHYSFINPRAGLNITSGHGSNDMHPDHDVALGEALYKNVYEALRASPQWNETLFILTFDEHGGFYDHMPPPSPIPAPGDGEKSYPDKFNFTRAGIRIPTLMASPWLPKGVILSDPPADQKPDPSSIYELTSIMATVRKLLSFMNETKPLTERDAWAATFEHMFEILDEPRTDCPMTLPDAPPPSAGFHLEEAESPINSLQHDIMTVQAHLAGVPYPHHLAAQKEFGPWAQKHHRIHRDATTAWKASKKNESYLVQLESTTGTCIGRLWFWAKNKTIPNVETLSLKLDNDTYCLDGGNMTKGSKVRLSLCYPSRDPANNRDPSQHWTLGKDHSIRSSKDPSLCVTNQVFTGTKDLYLQTCAALASQHYAYMWGAPSPDGGDVVFQFGDDYYELRVLRA